MRRSVTFAVSLCFLFFVFLVSDASAHGGVWRPPPSTGGPGPGPGTTGGGGGPTTGGPGGGVGSPSNSWELWWAFNRERYIPRHSIMMTEQLSGAPGFYAGRGKNVEGLDRGPILSEQARQEILPILAAALRDDSSEVVDSAAVAIARATQASAAGPFLGLIRSVLDHPERTPREAAVLGLGILGNEHATADLIAILHDTPEGRKLFGSPESIDVFHRGLAALALGFLDKPEATAALYQIAQSPLTDRELATAAVLALGMHKNSAASIVPNLAKLWDNPMFDREVKAQIPIAIQRLPGSSARALMIRFVETLADKKAPNSLRRSCAIALGNLARPDDREVLAALFAAMNGDTDALVRSFACMAVGRIAESHGVLNDPESTGEIYYDMHRNLLRLVFSRKHKTLQPFAAISLSLMLRGRGVAELPSEGTTLAQVASTKLLDALQAETDPSVQGALGIALGLIGEGQFASELHARMLATANRAVQGNLAIAVGLLQYSEAIPDLRQLLDDRGTSQSYRLDIARALGLLHDVEFQNELITMLETAKDLPSAAAASKALGLVGDKRSAQPLLTLVTDREQTQMRRAFAVVALGILAEKTPYPWNIQYSIDANYSLPNRSLAEVLSIL